MSELGYVAGAKMDQILERLDRILEIMEYDLTKKYPELKAKQEKK